MQKIKYFLQNETGKDILLVLIIILVGIFSFYLGRMSKNSSNQALYSKYTGDITLSAKALESSDLSSKSNDFEQKYIYEGIDLTGRKYFASKRGKKYYPFGCSAGKSIKEENRIYFDNEAEAKARGYSLSSSCD